MEPDLTAPGGIHHLELWVPDLGRAVSSWGWLLGRLGYEPFQAWEAGRSWRLGGTYVVVEESPALLRDVPHDRRRAGLNHVAFAVPARSGLDEIVRRLPAFGWSPLFAARYPHAGGPDHYAACLENDDGFEVELVAP